MINSKLTNQQIDQYCFINDENTAFLQTAIDKLNLSTRGLHRILKIARTIADLADSNNIEKNHLSEALNFRCMDRKQH